MRTLDTYIYADTHTGTYTQSSRSDSTHNIISYTFSLALKFVQNQQDFNGLCGAYVTNSLFLTFGYAT